MHEDRFTKQKCWHVHQEPLQQKKKGIYTWMKLTTSSKYIYLKIYRIVLKVIF